MTRTILVAVALATLGGAALKYGTPVHVAELTADASGAAPVDAPAETEDATLDAATACRDLAPDDPYVDDRDNGDRAYAACAEALAAAPEDPDLLYLTALSAMQAKRHPDEALDLVTRAEARGKCEARFIIAEDFWYGRHDAVQSEAWYRRGADCGDRRAAKALFQPEAFRDSDYADVLGAFYSGNISALNDTSPRPVTASYAIGFVQAIGETYNGDGFQNCWAAKSFRGGDVLYRLKAAERFDASNLLESWLYEQITPYVVAVFFPEFGVKALDEIREAARQAGRGDLIRLTSSGAKCDSHLTWKLAQGIHSFAAAKKSLFEVIKARRNDVQSVDDMRRIVLHGQP